MNSTNKQLTKIERFGLESVPTNLRTTSWYEYAMIQMTISVNAGNFLVPALAVLEGGLSFMWAVISTVLGAILAFVFVSFLSFPGARKGIPSQYAVRSFLGQKGAQYFASPVRTITSLYWFAVQTIGGTYMAVELLHRAFSITLPFLPVSLLLATLMATLALVGFNAVKKATVFLLPLLFAGTISMLIVFLTSTVGGNTFPSTVSSNEAPKFTTVFFYASLAFVQYVSGVSSSSDMARYARSAKHAFFGLFIGNSFGFLFTALLGAYTASVADSWNPFLITSRYTDSTILLTFIFIAALCSMFTINISNAYTGGYSLLNTFPSLGRVKSAIVLGCFAIVLSGFPTLVNEADQFISLLGAFVIPLSAIIITDFIILKKARFTSELLSKMNSKENVINYDGFSAIVLGMCFYLVLPVSLSPGFLSFFFTGILYLTIKKIRLLIKNKKVHV
ncbi:purine-cytosine permease family protein [Guptibacillus algicola]|uniref:purine-cytosine permease family protein n=1 Tax=Guptibacillus algicola TaxID=225844 RepID=UPI001CD3EE72|nr:cytosine permease [Alkalihalobacillus algicola]MCA0986352.1 cytosine permease [Alkalihalobacillus algicola]